jgi:hypothetical protein
MILVNDAPDDHNQQRMPRRQVSDCSRPAPGHNAALLGLVAENVNDLMYVQPEQVSPMPIPVPNAPYLDAIVKTDHEIIPVIAVQKLRGHLLCGNFSDQSAILNPPSTNPESTDSEHNLRTCET